MMGMSDDARNQLRETVRDFTRKEISPHLRAWEDAGMIPRSVTERAASLGLLGVGYPEEVGGGGGGLLDVFALIEGVIEGGGSIGVMSGLLAHGIVSPAVLASGTPEQIDRWVRPVLEGKTLCALAITEPDAGSDVARIRTRAVRDGDHYIVNGTKTFISNGVRADFVLTAVVTGNPDGDGGGGHSLLVIETDRPGFSVSRKLDKMGWLCSDTAELAFEDCAVPVTNLIGPEHAGFKPIMRNFQGERLIMAAQCYAVAQRCLELSLEYARVREAFGGPLVSHQVIRHKLAEMARQTDVARIYTHAIAERHVAGEEVSKQIAMAKNTAVRTLDHVVDEAVQIHGGMGYMRDSEVERHYRDSRIMGIGGGTNEIMNEIIAKRLLA
jgi:acyl-CoA dehydrogenase